MANEYGITYGTIAECVRFYGVKALKAISQYMEGTLGMDELASVLTECGEAIGRYNEWRIRLNEREGRED